MVDNKNQDDMFNVLSNCALVGEGADNNAKAADVALRTKKADRQIYGILVGQIESEQLLLYLEEQHSNQGAIALAKNYISNSRTHHIKRRELKIRELVEEMVVRPEFVPTDENAADIMTKPLGKAKFEKFRKMLLNHL